MYTPWGVTLSSVHPDRLLRVGGPRQGLVLGGGTVLDSFDNMKHNRLHMPRVGSHVALWKEAPARRKESLSSVATGLATLAQAHSLLTVYRGMEAALDTKM